MKSIRNFDQVLEMLSQRDQAKRAAVVWASDPSTQGAVAAAAKAGIIQPTMIGCRDAIMQNAELAALHPEIVDAADGDQAAALAVKMVREGKADIIIKGMLNTDNLLRAILNKETGILPKGSVLTHVAALAIPAYPRLLFFSDAAVIPNPTLEQLRVQVGSMVSMARRLGVEEPRVALIHCTEKVDPRHFPITESYVALKEDAAAGLWGKCIVDGPIDLKVACSRAAMEKKGMHSPLDGEADALVMPDIQAGNILYKALTLFANATTAGVLVGAQVPVVLPSRGDTIQSKLQSIALASL